MNLSERIIKGYIELHLIPENKYQISYGINQGIYIYKGQLEESDDEFWSGASLFINEKTGNKFCYYGSSSPYEFTSIVKPL